MTPDSAVQLQKLGYDCAIESGAGLLAGFQIRHIPKQALKLRKQRPPFGKM